MTKINTSRNRVVALGLIAFQLSSFCFADARGAPTVTPEVQLLITVAAEAGMPLSATERQARISQEIAAYNNIAPTDGREDRFVNALVETRMMAPAQAQTLRENADTTTQAQLALNPNSNAEQVLNSSIQTVLSNLNGAQFSGCKRDAGLAVGGVLIALVGAGVGMIKSCSIQIVTFDDSEGMSAGSSGSVGSSSSGSSAGSNSPVNSGPANICTNPHSDLGWDISFAGIAVMIGAVILSATVDRSSC
jgi:hypothetical protein